MKKFHFAIISALAACFMFSQSAWAFSTSSYATTSKLASGKWVKIQISENGVYELTSEELAKMGFSNIASVKVYGAGGHALKEVLDGTATDDLQLVPVARYSNKLCFYAKGPVAFTLENPTTAKAHYTRTLNTYSQTGYYFLTEGSGDDAITKAPQSGVMGTDGRATSLSCFYHEKEEMSAGFTGKELLGERITDSNNSFDYSLPGLVEGESIVLNPSVAARLEGTSAAVGYIKAYLNTGSAIDTVNFTPSSSAINYCESSLIYYNKVTPVSVVTPSQHSETGKLILGFTVPSTMTMPWGRLDYFTLTYYRHNKLLANSNGQFQMGFNNVTTDMRVDLPDAPSDLVVWNIDNEGSPVEYTYSNYTMESGETVKAFSPQLTANWAQFVAFSPSQTLMKISGYETVENQNIHGEPTPDMVIVCNKTFLDQAERVAQMHRDNDGMKVLVVDQDKVFNEFSSGTPDAMAIRLMNKMFYDRNSEKFKYLLMFGCGSFDNRGITTNKKNRLITYQSDNSNNENTSYVSDDFFGVLADYSTASITKEPLTIGVGRIPSATDSEAKNDVDKLLTYVNDPDYGVWRNNFLTTSDEGDNNKHLYQATGINDLIVDELATGMVPDKAYVDIFPNASTTSEPGVEDTHLTATEARRHITESLKAGQYFWTYVGHAGPSNYTKLRHMWTNSDAQSVTYEHLPIFTTACCDVARYDSDIRGIAEKQFHKKDGGAIALFTSPRSVLADNNDRLNRAWVTAMFSYSSTGEMPRLGDIYQKTKQAFGASEVYDKVKFFMLGDPAMQVNYPKPYFKITKVNGTDITEGTEVKVRPLQQLTITAQVMTEDGSSVDTNFNGDAYVTLYDQESTYKSITAIFNGKSTTRTVKYPRTQLAQVAGHVLKGVFTATLVVPRYVDALNTKGLISVYGHKEKSTEMVNGNYSDLVIDSYLESEAIVDNESPTIEKMYFNDESQFTEGGYIASSATLYVQATDNVAICNKSVGLSSAMTLVLDGGKASYQEVKSHATIQNEGKLVNIALPMSGLESGQHTLTYTVSDASGNKATRTISFIVGPASEITLSTEETPAIDKATFNIDTELTETPTVKLTVTDAAGKSVWETTTSSFPLVWDLKDANGKKVAPGLYRYYGTYQTTSEYGGTDISNLIVIDGYKSNK